MANYVKFQRGSQAAYNALQTAGKLDENTLYFIYAEDNASVGALYMGTRIISGGDITIASATLDDLADVIVTGAGTNAFLVKDGNNWVAKELDDVVTLIKDSFGDVAAAAQVFQGEQTSEQTADEAIAAAVGDALPADGDNAIIKKLIADDKYEYTAYVYEGEAWKAMDGNYNATNVFFDSDLTLTAAVGVQTIPSSGSKVLETTGKNIKQVLDMLFASRKTPTRTLPSVKVTASNSTTYEVGSSVALAYSASFDKGSYTYGPDTGVVVEEWSAKLGNETIAASSGTFAAINIEDNTNTRIAVTATYSAGTVPVDNLGNVLTDGTELANCQIQAGSTVGYGAYVKGTRKSFSGSKTAAVDLTSANIRGLTSKNIATGTLSVAVGEGSAQVIIAVPAAYKVTAVADTGAFGTDIFNNFSLQTVSVGGADATADDIGSYATDYNVYVYAPSTALGSNTYNVTVAKA